MEEDPGTEQERKGTRPANHVGHALKFQLGLRSPELISQVLERQGSALGTGSFDPATGL